MSAVTIRAGGPADALGIATVQLTSWRETYAGLVPAAFWDEHPLERFRDRWQGWLDAGATPPVAVAGGAVVGFAYVGAAQERGGHPPVRERQLFTIYLLAAWHGSGAGQLLLDAALPAGEPAELWVAADNPRARRFYERNGFAPDGATVLDPDFAGLPELRLVR
ncbi:GNAT family N-acetyltransferase [Microbacteriaceae bacterium VKM Ac-2854]|nr:GNAT family N-acetyltransferase [Microbacteriaceae bacterium VKM Ac-2854]